MRRLTQKMSIAIVPNTDRRVSFGAYARMKANIKAPNPRNTPKTIDDL